MTATSGNLKPSLLLAYFDKNNKAVAVARNGKASGKTVTIDSAELPLTQNYYILASREGVDKGTTRGKFTLSLDGSGSTDTASSDSSDSPCIGVEDPTAKITPSKTKKWSEPDEVINPDNQYCAILTTAKGRIVIELYPQSAPKNVNSFVFLAQKGYYDNITWHRVIPKFVAQTGDPTGKGTGSPGYTVPLEIDPDLTYDREGRVGAARAQDPDSAGSQFFITYAPLPSLDPHSKELPDSDGYTIFGQVVEGMDVVRGIKAFEVDKNPSGKGDKLVSVRIVELQPDSK
ncbi:MAG: peptidylprolyl isomerase [Anaerolineae bacterium]|nr:peptidylprolyl isomerase [Anaerolineae bacterium]